VDLLEEFSDLAASSSADTFNAVPLRSARQDFLGKGQQGAPVFLIADEGAPAYRPVVQHRHLSAVFGVLCRLNVNGVEVVGRFALVRFEGNAPELHELFIRCVQAAIEDLPEAADTSDIEKRVTRLLALFRSLARPAGREITGLWAELYCIAVSGNVPAALERWHSDNNEVFDFSWPQGRLEVKATVGTFRIHEFALDQLRPPCGGAGYVASLMLKPSNSGVGVLELARQVESAIPGQHQLQAKLWAVLVQSLGADFSDALDRRFDAELARGQLMVFRMEDIPSVPPVADARISSVRFKADLSTVQNSLGSAGAGALRTIF
jgi:hypothetical protein